MSHKDVAVFVSVAGWFGFGKKKAREQPAPPPPPPVAPPPPPPTPEPSKPAGADVKFRGLHPDTNPSSSVRPQTMTCPSCGRNFRYFVNASGVKTTANCPGCGRQYRV